MANILSLSKIIRDLYSRVSITGSGITSLSTTPPKDSNGTVINKNTVISSTNNTIPTAVNQVSNTIVYVDEDGTTFCRFNIVANSSIILDSVLKLKSDIDFSKLLKLKLRLLVRDTEGANNNMWINSEGVATIGLQNVAGKRVTISNDSDQLNTFLLIIS